MSPRWLLVRRLVSSLPLLAVATTAFAAGCGGAKQAEDAAYAQPPAQQAHPQPAPYDNAQPGAAPPPPPRPGQPGGDVGPPQPTSPSPPPVAEPKNVGTTQKDLGTLRGALAALEEEELRLEQMLDDETIQLDDASTCGRVCDALASMRRAADAICDLAGKDDDRCDRAQDKVQSNETRVSEAGCSCA